jgi:hypothetical protein
MSAPSPRIPDNEMPQPIERVDGVTLLTLSETAARFPRIPPNVAGSAEIDERRAGS